MNLGEKARLFYDATTMLLRSPSINDSNTLWFAAYNASRAVELALCHEINEQTGKNLVGRSLTDLVSATLGRMNIPRELSTYAHTIEEWGERSLGEFDTYATVRDINQVLGMCEELLNFNQNSADLGEWGGANNPYNPYEGSGTSGIGSSTGCAADELSEEAIAKMTDLFNDGI